MASPKLDISLINQLRREESPAGLCNLFLPINDEWGIKFCRSEFDRDKIYKRQKAAAEHGLAPIVGDKVQLPQAMYFIDDCGYEIRYQYGYFTEKVQVVGYDRKLRNDKEKDILCYKLSELVNFRFIDCHWGNIGIKDGQYVCIDFD